MKQTMNVATVPQRIHGIVILQGSFTATSTFALRPK